MDSSRSYVAAYVTGEWCALATPWSHARKASTVAFVIASAFAKRASTSHVASTGRVVASRHETIHRNADPSVPRRQDAMASPDSRRARARSARTSLFG
jgi:hypothetical protein